ncbi:hypothetical protein [Halalkalibacter alkalisediminis]|uniref:Uncharacterized protein n=1 Tax=Halalkalibacter alkalisediminis TaxID=935616 RepID=A0ABV6NJI7_9BACI|nr:hypothetical protein [Halalkalibacter alkalisediminis]
MSDSTLSSLISYVHSTDFCEMCANFNIKIDLSHKSIKQLEEEVPQLYRSVEDDLKPKLAILFGVYYGEVLKKMFDGTVEWGSYYPVEPDRTELRIINEEVEVILRPVLAIKDCVYKGESLAKHIKSIEDIVNSN